MKNFIIYILAISFLVMLGCSKDDENPTPTTEEPVASFDVSNNSPEIDEVITFTNKSQNATSYEWEFGDGNSSNDTDPSHSYSSEGTFTVTLTASGDGGVNSTSMTITVMKSPPIADFSMDKTSAEVGETITFTNQSQNATSYEWEFGDGNSSNDTDPSHSYSSEGTFTVTLNATGDRGTDSTTKSIEITPPSNPLLGTWDLVSGTFQGAGIPDLSGYREFGDEEIGGGNWTGDSRCSMTQGSDRGTVIGAYEIAGNSLIYGTGTTIISWTNNTSNFSNFGVVGLGLQNVEYSISGNVLTITGVNSNGTTVLTYEKQ